MSTAFDEDGRPMRTTAHDVPTDDGTGTMMDMDLITTRTFNDIGLLTPMEEPDGRVVEYVDDDRHNVKTRTTKPRTGSGETDIVMPPGSSRRG